MVRRTISKSFLPFFILILFFSSGIRSGFASGGLFLEAEETFSPVTQPGPPWAAARVQRTRPVRINFSHLRGEPSGEPAGSLVLNLFEGMTLDAFRERVEERTKTGYTWFGRIAGVAWSHVILVVDGETMTGNIFREGDLYQVRPMADGIHVLRQVDQSRFPEETPPIPVFLIPDLSASQALSSPSASNPVIDVLVVFTADAARASSNIQAEIQLGIDETNQTYNNSGVRQRVRLAHAAQVAYAETGHSYTDLIRLQNSSDGYMDSVQSMRRTYGADIVSLWVEDLGEDCGISYLMTNVSSSFAPYALNVVARDCATGYFSFGHEMGHILGAGHDRYEESDGGAFPFSHGYVHPAGRWRTVMAYNTECSDQGFYCARIPYWSNPDVLYEGAPTGVSWNARDSADNRLTLNQTAATVAGFRDAAGSPLKLIGKLEHPQNRKAVSGVSTIEGWGLDGKGITRVELFIDRKWIEEISYGGTRTDVASAHPDYPNAESSGFSTTFDFSTLAGGYHSIRVRLHNQEEKTLDLRAIIRVKK